LGEKHHVLVADDEPNMRRVLAAMLERQGLEVHSASGGTEAAALLAGQEMDLVITDLRMGEDMDGMDLLRHAQNVAPDVPVVLVTAHGSVDTAVEAMKLGAFDFVMKPFEQEEITAIVKKALKAAHLGHAYARPMDAAEGQGAYGMIGQSPRMQEVFDVIRKVADTPSTVLITGESGTGKELVAKALHEHSSRRKRPLIRINCAAIPDTLVESELFGHERGAFTGAVSSKPGRFELAHGGTLFLDEVGEIPAEMQVKLLRVLQESEFERVGGVRTLQVDVRLVTATNRELADDIRDGRFRDDLYYRLNVVPIPLPPLRERRPDIPLLIKHFLAHFNTRLGKRVAAITPEAMGLLTSYAWPGNIRQLENVLERTILFCESEEIMAGDLPAELLGSAARSTTGAPTAVAAAAAGPAAEAAVGGTGLKAAVREATELVERDAILKALEQTEGNVTRAAKVLKISRKSLQNKMKELGLRSVAEGLKS
jgi:two-component system response regulator AtoC